MPKRPSRMPSVRGRGAVAAGFRAVFKKLNELAEYVDTLRPIVDPTNLASQTSIGTVQQVSGQWSVVSGQLLQQFILKPIDGSLDNAIKDDYVLAYQYEKNFDGQVTISTQATPIARDWLLRRTPFDGKTWTIDGVAITYAYTSNTERVATFAGGSETQVIVPHYFENCIIYAQDVADNLGVIHLSGTSPAPVLRVPVRLIEVSSRAWALKA